VQVSNACGNATSSNSITINITGSAPTVPTITAGGPTAICAGGSVLLSIPSQSGVTYQWKNGTNNVGSNSNSYTANAIGNYTLVLSNNCGTVTSLNVITVAIVGGAPSAPTITANGNINFCQGGGVALEIPAQTGVDYQWKVGNNNVGTNSNSLTVTSAGTFTVVATNGCGSANSINSITTTVNQLPATPSITANGTTTFCTGSVTLSAPAGFQSYQWNTGDTTQSISVNASGTFTVIVYGVNGCQSGVSNSVSTNVSNTPVLFNLAASICSGQTYSFNNQTIMQAGVYKDTLVNATGCDSVITLNLSITPALQGSFSQTICLGGSYNFNGQALTQSGTFKDTVQTLGGCDSIITLNLTALNKIENTINAAICAGQTYDFKGKQLTQQGQYLDTLISSGGCDSILTLNLTVNALPQPTIVQTGTALSTQTFATYLWQLAGIDITTATAQNYTANTNGNYTVLVTDANGCSAISPLVTVAGEAIEDLQATAMRFVIYPNPASKTVTIETDIEIQSIEVLSLLGELVQTQNGTTKVVNVSQLAEGIYIIKLQTTNGKAAYKRFIKQ